MLIENAHKRIAVFNELAKEFGFSPWPEGDDGDNVGDKQIAEVLENGDYATSTWRSGVCDYSRVILFALRLGRRLYNV